MSWTNFSFAILIKLHRQHFNTSSISKCKPNISYYGANNHQLSTAFIDFHQLVTSWHQIWSANIGFNQHCSCKNTNKHWVIITSSHNIIILTTWMWMGGFLQIRQCPQQLEILSILVALFWEASFVTLFIYSYISFALKDTAIKRGKIWNRKGYILIKMKTITKCS